MATRGNGLRSWMVSATAVGLLLAFQPAAQAGGPTPPPKSPPSVAQKAAVVHEGAPAAATPAPEVRNTSTSAAPDAETSGAIGTPAPQASMQIKVRLRTRDIYFGQYRTFQRPAVLDTQKVFDAISFYQEVKSERLTKSSGRYWILMQKSNRIFYKALKRVSAEQGYDLIGARTAILIDGAPPVDVTETLLAIIPSITLD
ncbi:MAG: hypothetical protein JXQ29_02475 [Planctomycetes bacterium]|nr:hypothetical protein [Planctomycetota bacterium]